MKSNQIDVSKLNFDDRESIKEFIANNESSMYGGKDVEGRQVVVMLQQGQGMDVMYLNSKNWYEGYSYDKNGFRDGEILKPAHRL